jgi:hypothetical protein
VDAHLSITASRDRTATYNGFFRLHRIEAVTYSVKLNFIHGGDGLQIWRVAAIILNKQSRTADKG